MSLNSEVIAKFGSQYSTTEISDAINVQNVKLMSAQFVWTNDTPSGVDFISGSEEVQTVTFPAKAAATNGDYLVVYDGADPWAASLSVEGISEVTEVTAVADIEAVAEVTDITCIDDSSVKEVTAITAVADVDDSLDKTYFILQDDEGSVGFWIDTDNSGTQVDPALVAATDRQVELITVTTDMTAAQVGSAIYLEVIADSKFEAGADTEDGSFTVQSSTYGVKPAASAGNSGFTVTESVAGVDSNLDGSYFLLQDTDGSVAFWIDIDNSGTAAPVHGADRAIEITTISSADDAATIAGLLETAIHADAKFTASSALTVVTVTNVDTEDLADAADGDTGFTFDTTTQGVTVDSLDDTHFILQDVDGSVAFWFDVGNTGTTIPAGADAADRAIEITTVTAGDDADTVAGLVATAIDADGKFAATAAAAVITVTNADKKALTDAADGDSGFSFSVVTQGADLCTAPSGAIWTAIAAGQKVQVDISATTDAASVAAAVELAFDALVDVPFTTSDVAADGTMTFTAGAKEDSTAPVVKSTDDSGAGSITAETTTAGVATGVNVTSNSVTITDHGLVTGVKGQLTTDGTLPAGLATSNDYFIIVVDANNVKFAASLANAQAGTAVVITDVGTSGATHTLTATAVAGAAVKLQASNDKVNWIDIANTSTSITGDSQALESVEDVSWVWVRAHFTATAGIVSLDATFCIKYEV